MNKICKVLSLLTFAFSCSLGFSQNIDLKTRTEIITVKEDSSFVNETAIIFEISDSPRVYPVFYDTELEKVSDIQLFERKGKRLKKLKLRSFEEDVELDYITSKKIKSIIIPEDKEVKLTYSVACKELMYLSTLPFFSYNKIDTLKYQINIPNTFQLTHNTIYRDSLSFYKIDSTHIDSGSKWEIKVLPMKVEPDPLQFFGIYKNMKVPLMRTLVLPNSYKSQPRKYMNDWYFKNVASQKGISADVMQKIDELTLGVTDSSEIVKILYNYIRSNFKYVAIEIGMGAFIPSPANEVYINKQGDCKDLSNFLSEILNYKGIDNDLALAATFSHITDCDFPSLSSANHVICVAYVNNEKVLLDPTDSIHLEGTPVQSLQDRTILIINSEGGSFYEVKRFSPEQNSITYQLDLKMNSDNDIIEGGFNIDYKGLSSNYLKRIMKAEDSNTFKKTSNTFFEEMFGNQKTSNLLFSNQSKQLNFEGNISVNGKTFNDGTNQYLFIDFLPRLIETETRETLIEGTYLGYPFEKKVVAKIKLIEPIESFSPIKHHFKSEGISLDFVIKANSNLEIECSYDFIFDHIFIDKTNINLTNEILESFKKIVNEPIVLKKQKG